MSAALSPQTSDSGVVGVVSMEDFALLTGVGIKPSNSSGRLRKWMEKHFHGNVIEVEVKAEGVAVAQFRPGTLKEILKVSLFRC